MYTTLKDIIYTINRRWNHKKKSIIDLRSHVLSNAKLKEKKANTREEELRVSEKYEKYLLSYISQINSTEKQKEIFKKRRYSEEDA